jgi:hypothetical protein
MINFNVIFNPNWAYLKNAFCVLAVCWCLYAIHQLVEEQNVNIKIEAPRQFMAPLKELDGPDVFSNQTTY